MDVSLLDDEELAQQLKIHGVTPGPIVGSTRKFYEKKLQKLLNDIPAEGYHAPPEPEEEYSEADDDDEEEISIQPVTIPPGRSKPIRSSPQETSTHITHRPTGLARPSTASYREQRQQQPSSQTPARTKVPPSTPPPKKESKPLIPLWAKLLIIIVFVLFVYLVIQNMEPAKGDLPKLPEDSNV